MYKGIIICLRHLLLEGAFLGFTVQSLNKVSQTICEGDLAYMSDLGGCLIHYCTTVADYVQDFLVCTMD